MPALSFGKTRVEIQARGCTRCGTEYSSGRSTAREVEIAVDKHKPVSVMIQICADCRPPDPSALTRKESELIHEFKFGAPLARALKTVSSQDEARAVLCHTFTLITREEGYRLVASTDTHR